MCYIIEVKTDQTAVIKTLIDTINSLLSDVNFIFYPQTDKNEGGIIVQEINKTGKILVYIKLKASKFTKYRYNYNKEKFLLGIDINNLSKCLKCMSTYDSMTWLVDEEDINKLIIVIESNERKEKKIFKMNLMDLEEDNYEIAPIQYTYDIVLPSQDFHKYCKDMAVLSEKIEIKTTTNKIFFSGKGEICNVEFEIDQSSNGLQIINNTNNINEIVQGLYELRFLLIFTKCSSLCNTVRLLVKNDYPLVVCYNIDSIGELKLNLSLSKPY